MDVDHSDALKLRFRPSISSLHQAPQRPDSPARIPTARRVTERSHPRGSVADAVLDVRSPRFESTDAIRRANLRIDRRPSILPTDALDLQGPPSSDTVVRTDLWHLDEATSSATSSAALAQPSSSSPTLHLKASLSATTLVRRDSARRKAPPGAIEQEAIKGLEKEVLKFHQQEEDQRYQRAMRVLEADAEETFAMISASGKRNKKMQADVTSPSLLLQNTNALLKDLMWAVGAFSAALLVGFVLVRIEHAIRSLANRRNPLGRFLTALWVWMFASVLTKQHGRLYV